MADRDLEWYSSNTGGPDMRAGPVTAAQAFRTGEPVVGIAAGTLSEAGDDPSAITGIAAHRTTDVDGTDLGVGHPVTYYGTGPEQVFKTTNFATAGAGVAVTPSLTDIWDLAGLTLASGVWSLDTGTNNLIAEIIGVLDNKGVNLADPNLLPGTGSVVLFRFI